MQIIFLENANNINEIPTGFFKLLKEVFIQKLKMLKKSSIKIFN